jgi:hypothetical protein
MTDAPVKAGLLVREVDGEVLVLDAAADRIHQLNASASLIWRLHERGADAAEIAASLAIEFDLDKHRAYTDVKAALEQFRSLNLID